LIKQEKIKKLINIAENLVGAPYQYGAYFEPQKNSKPQAFDCSSFIQYTYKKIGADLPRSSLLQASRGREIKSPKDLLPGDLLFFEGTRGHYQHKLFKKRKLYIGHVALCVGNGEIIHAQEERGVIEHPVYDGGHSRPSSPKDRVNRDGRAVTGWGNIVDCCWRRNSDRGRKRYISL